METHQIKQVQYEANQLLEIRALLSRISRKENVRISANDPLVGAGVCLLYTNDNACYRAVANALETYEVELTRKFSRVNEVSS